MLRVCRPETTNVCNDVHYVESVQHKSYTCFVFGLLYRKPVNSVDTCINLHTMHKLTEECIFAVDSVECCCVLFEVCVGDVCYNAYVVAVM
jgi:hypothetical protein